MIQVIGIRDQRLHTTTLAATSLYKYDTKLLEFETNVFTPLLLLDVTMSQYNMAHVSIIMDLVVKLIDLPGVRASNILILTFYKAQLSVLTKSIDKLDEARPTNGSNPSLFAQSTVSWDRSTTSLSLTAL